MRRLIIAKAGKEVGTGYNDKVRHYQDCGSRIYFMEAEERNEE